ncbi:unnamed protein product [Schistosoma mattheei]|uniref:Uncharacterized protein n=1 Tax=Schistosoma mattheei TaxID=31246 RepID=A0A183NW97_9TREM|nr:unnamed protein product [Schistosoma mattheei]
METSSTLRRASEDSQYHTEFIWWITLQNRAWRTVDKVVRSEDQCQTSTSEGKHGIQWTSRMQVDDLDFADDLALLSHTQQQMQEKTTSAAAAASAAVGLNIHKGKSKILRYNTACINRITIDGEALEDIETFTYVSSIIDEHENESPSRSIAATTRSPAAAFQREPVECFGQFTHATAKSPMFRRCERD